MEPARSTSTSASTTPDGLTPPSGAYWRTLKRPAGPPRLAASPSGLRRGRGAGGAAVTFSSTGSTLGTSSSPAGTTSRSSSTGGGGGGGGAAGRGGGGAAFGAGTRSRQPQWVQGTAPPAAGASTAVI